MYRKSLTTIATYTYVTFKISFEFQRYFQTLLHIYANISECQHFSSFLDYLGCCLLLSLVFRFPFPSFVVRFLLDILLLVFAAAPTILNIFPPHTCRSQRCHFARSSSSHVFHLSSRLTLHFIQCASVVNLPYFSCLDIRLARFDT
jgi:hypothetical protein